MMSDSQCVSLVEFSDFSEDDKVFYPHPQLHVIDGLIDEGVDLVCTENDRETVETLFDREMEVYHADLDAFDEMVSEPFEHGLLTCPEQPLVQVRQAYEFVEEGGTFVLALPSEFWSNKGGRHRELQAWIESRSLSKCEENGIRFSQLLKY